MPGKAAALAIAAVTMWQPRWGLALLALLAPAGALLAAAPARGAELLAWALVAGWLLAIWRPLSKAGWPRTVMVPFALYACALIASWLSLTIAGAAGVPPGVLPRFIGAAIAGNHLILSSPEPETWTLLQALAGLGVFAAAVGIAHDDSRSVRAVGWALVMSMTILAAATLTQAGAFRGERFSFPVADLNAAGSLYALAAVIALGYAWLQHRQRILWLASLVVLTPAIWLSGSRSAYFAIAAGAAVLAAVRHAVAADPPAPCRRRHAVSGRHARRRSPG